MPQSRPYDLHFEVHSQLLTGRQTGSWPGPCKAQIRQQVASWQRTEMHSRDMIIAGVSAISTDTASIYIQAREPASLRSLTSAGCSRGLRMGMKRNASALADHLSRVNSVYRISVSTASSSCGVMSGMMHRSRGHKMQRRRRSR